MKRALVSLSILIISFSGFSQIIADHTVVDQYDKIPQHYIDEVKKMLVDIAGESHSAGYRYGVSLLAELDSRFRVTTYVGNRPSRTTTNLRLGTHGTVGEAQFYTSQSAINSYKSHITSQYSTGNPYSVIGFGWCWDMTWQNSPGGGVDPVYNVRWAGSSEGGPQGSRRWGLDAGDESLTGNSVCMDTYLDAVEQYIAHCRQNGYDTRVIFTTGPVDDGAGNIGGTENGFQRELKHDYIRDYVRSDPSRILFDYADILCWSNGGEQNIATWNQSGTPRRHAHIHPENMMDYDRSWNMISHVEDGDHIGEVGALRLGKAMWWMLARIAGWDGGSGSVAVTGITVTGAGGSTAITTNKGQLQLTAAVAPSNATNKTVTWSLVNGTGQATINNSGVVTAVANGNVTARATTNDGSGVAGSLQLTISGQVIPVTGITVRGANNATTITQNRGTLALSATVLPDNATNKAVTWSIVNGTGQATINNSGVVTAFANGNVTARATANDGSGVVGSLQLTISGQVILVTGITVTGAGGSSVITTDKGQLQLSAAVAPSNATNRTVTWSVRNGTGSATISSTGLVTAVSGGIVTAVATANDGSGVEGTLQITITNQYVAVTSITVHGANNATTITQNKGTLALSATVLPDNATNKTVTWSIVNGTGQATINQSGVVTAVANGNVTARATASDGSGVVGSLQLTISGQVIPVTGITVTGADGSSVITTDKGQLQLTAAVAPSNATNKSVTWSLINGTGQATINNSGVVTAVANGNVTARATANDGSGVVGSLQLTISGQVIPVTGITVRGSNNATTITQNKGTLALSATVLPDNATNKSVTWSIVNGTGQATINNSGVVTAVANGNVTARATASDGSGVVGSLQLTISGQVIPVTAITITGAGGSSVITTDKGQLQLSAAVVPSNATNRTVTWSVRNGTGSATISSTGLVTAVSGGNVTAVATANDGSGVEGTLQITMTNQYVAVTSITVRGANNATTITQNRGTLALSATVLPDNATNKSVTWSIVNGTGQATINQSGVVTAVANGNVTARATANDGSGVVGSLQLTISGQVILVTGITVTGAGGSSVITTDKGQLQLSAAVTPSNATNRTVTWSVRNGTGSATISSTGLVMAVSGGNVTAVATANDGSGVEGSLQITITNQYVAVTSITVRGANNATAITQNRGALALSATVLPDNATNKSVTWSIVNGTGQATINNSGVVTAVANGNVTARATANDGSGVTGELSVTISGQFVGIDKIIVSASKGDAIISSLTETLYLSAIIMPADATNQDITWSIINGTGQATISQSGLVTALAEGTVTAVATANDGSGTSGELPITILSQLVEVTSITITPANNLTSTVAVNGTLELLAEILPANASLPEVAWGVINGTGTAEITRDGLLTGLTPGEVTVTAAASDGSGVTALLTVIVHPEKKIKIRFTRHEIVIEVPDHILPAKASLHSLFGAQRLTKNLDSTVCTIDISDFVPGFYIVTVYNSMVQDAAKVVIGY